MRAYQAAHQLDVTDQETVRGIAEVSFRLKDWPSALTNYFLGGCAGMSGFAAWAKVTKVEVSGEYCLSTNRTDLNRSVFRLHQPPP